MSFTGLLVILVPGAHGGFRSCGIRSKVPARVLLGLLAKYPPLCKTSPHHHPSIKISKSAELVIMQACSKRMDQHIERLLGQYPTISQNLPT